MSRAGSRLLRQLTAALLAAAVITLGVLAFLRARGLKSPVREVTPPRAEQAGEGSDEEAVGLYTGFRYIESVAGKILFALSSERTLGLASGWHEIQGVRLQFYNQGVGGAVLTCESARFNRETRDARLVGAIHFEFPDGGFVTTERGVFDSSTSTFQAEADAVFSGGGTIGNAGRAVYHVDEDVLLLEDVVVRLAEGGTILSPRISYHRATGFVSMPLGVQVSRSGLSLAAPEASTTLSAPDSAPERFAFTGGVTIEGRGGEASSELSAWAEKITAVRDGSGRWQVAGTTSGPWVEVTLAGDTGFLHRRIQTWSLRAAIGPGGLEGLRADDGVCLFDVPMEAAPRRGTATRLRLTTTEGAAADVELSGGVVLSSGDIEARGSRARLVQADQLAMLYGDRSRGIRATLVTADAEVVADQVHLFEQTQRAEARGDVQGRVDRMSLLAGGDEAAGEPLRFAAEVLEVAEGGELLVLRSSARAWQGERLLFADEIRYRRAGERLDATGRVRTTFPAGLDAIAPGAPAPEPGATPAVGRETLVMARSLEYERPARKARYSGDVRYSDGQYVLTSSELEVLFGEADQVDTVVAIGLVDILEVATGRRLRGERAVWDTASHTVEVTGNPAQLTDEQGNTTSAASLTWDRASGRVTFSGGTETIYRPEERP